WAFMSHENGHDIHAFNDGAGTWSRSVFWEDGNIKPYLSGDCNPSPNGNYATNMVHYFRFLSDSISGRAVHRTGDQFVTNDIMEHDGHLHLQ
ncbi:MAG: hypothetical protein V4679_16860, partial [Pseudomonadota bacterium]